MKCLGSTVLIVALLFSGIVEAQEKIVSKDQVDYVFKMNREEWEKYVQQVFPGWKKIAIPHESGTALTVFYENSKIAMSIQPFYKTADSSPEMLVIGNFLPIAETFPEVTKRIKEDWQNSAQDDLGPSYQVHVVYKKMGEHHIVDLLITRLLAK
jgi:hypothetical protein